MTTVPPTGPTGFDYLDAVHEQPGTVLAFAHRGGAYHPDIEGLENTLRAFQHAVELGYDYLETDVHVTQDGVLLAFHDSVLDRVTDATGAIATSTYAEVQRALINGSDPVPTLAELFDAFPDARFNIDLKSAGAVPALAAVPRRAPGLGPGLRRVVLRPAAAPLPPPHVRAGGDLGVARSRWRRTGCSRAARPARHPRPAAGPPGPAPARAADDRHRRARTPRAPRRASRCTSGPSTTPRRCRRSWTVVSMA